MRRPLHADIAANGGACLRVRSHYLDITGEEGVFEALAKRDAEAKAAGIVLLPGVGFDVVPSDCLAVHLKRRLPSATRLALGFQSAGHMSRGTALTVLESLSHGGVARENGLLRWVPAAWKTRVIDFGNGPATAITIPWGDVATASSLALRIMPRIDELLALTDTPGITTSTRSRSAAPCAISVASGTNQYVRVNSVVPSGRASPGGII